MSKFCTNCGTRLEDDVTFCTGCGQKVDGGVNAAPVNNSVENVNISNNGGGSKTNGLAIAGFTVTLVSTILCCGIFNMVGLVLSIIGLVKAKDYDGNGKGLAIAGIVICCVCILISIIFTIFFNATGVLTEIINEASSV